LKDHHYAPINLQPVLEAMYEFPPENVLSRESSHYDQKYRELSKEYQPGEGRLFLCAMHAVIDSKEGAILRSKTSFWSNHPENRVFLYMAVKAAIFELAHIGNCGSRVAYSAFQLFELLKSANIEIEFYFFEKRNQTILYLKDKASGERVVYDPLTNPNLIFTESEYQNILEYFPEKDEVHLGDAHLVVTKANYDAFSKKWRLEIQESFLQAIDRSLSLYPHLEKKESLLDKIKQLAENNSLMFNPVLREAYRR